MFFICIFSDYVINSRVVSASLSQGRHIQLPKNVEITFQHLTPNLTDPVCVFWNSNEVTNVGRFHSLSG